MRYNFDSELPTLLDIGQMNEGTIQTKKRNTSSSAHLNQQQICMSVCSNNCPPEAVDSPPPPPSPAHGSREEKGGRGGKEARAVDRVAGREAPQFGLRYKLCKLV